MSQVPRVCVLLPVHNGEKYIESALRSVMGQSLRDIEILVVDDGSTDETPAILARLAAEDARIRVERPDHNLRLPGALNFGLDRVQAPYVARMDADDLCEPDRLEIQARFLDAHPDIVLVGCGAIDIDAEDHEIRRRPAAADPFAVRWKLRFNLPFSHPTFMYRGAAMGLRYDALWTVSEDYDIAARLSERGKMACLPEMLLRYRVHDASITGTKFALQLEEALAISTRVQKTDLDPDIFDAMAIFRETYYRRLPLDGAGKKTLFDAFRQMIAADLRQAPDHGQWMQRQSAQLLWTTLWRSGVGKSDALRTFARYGADFLPAFALRGLELRGTALPGWLRSTPDVWGMKDAT